MEGYDPKGMMQGYDPKGMMQLCMDLKDQNLNNDASRDLK